MSSDDICAKSSGVISRVRTEDVRSGLFLSFKLNIRERIQCLHPPWLERLVGGGDTGIRCASVDCGRRIPLVRSRR
jgi:hypothetical protein